MRRRIAVTAIAMAALTQGCAMTSPNGSAVRTYYIAADEVDWDYAPSGKNLITNGPFEGMAKRYMEPAPGRVGRVWHKAIYREYTDSTFTTLKPRPPEWEHLGMLGPLVRGTVGDTIKILFKNNASFPASMHPHGVIYNKDSEGAPYADGTTGADKYDDGVPTGKTHLYTWPVPERAGPTSHEGKSAFWMYHSHTEEVSDFNSGLVGAMIITARGAARADGTPNDVDREFIVAFLEMDENSSPYFEQNYAKYAKPFPKMPKMPVDTTFGALTRGPATESSFRETINGFSYGNTKGMTMKTGERVRWYVMGTTDFEVHAPHWHGNVVVAHNMRTDVLSVTTMEMVTADMTPDNAGTWLFHCHVANHLRMGMEATYTVAK
ncbi:MAG TPA: multicopper oxidase domain-containing protein [Gemmatimonadaceae bacterium]|nr:multicopper oxidase domain-containing protein [Gemmatimonadaceae bacterium]